MPNYRYVRPDGTVENFLGTINPRQAQDDAEKAFGHGGQLLADEIPGTPSMPRIDEGYEGPASPVTVYDVDDLHIK